MSGAELRLGAVAYHPRIVTIWERFRTYFADAGLPTDYILFSNYERLVDGLLERGIRATGYVRTPGRSGEGVKAERLEALVLRVPYLIDRFREGVRNRILAALPEHPYAGVLIALAIGDQRAIDTGQWQLFARTGVSHLMSISGLHVTMIAGLFAALVSFGWRRSERLALALPAQKAAALAGFWVFSRRQGDGRADAQYGQ